MTQFQRRAEPQYARECFDSLRTNSKAEGNK